MKSLSTAIAMTMILLAGSAFGKDCPQREKNRFQDCGLFRSSNIPILEQRMSSAQGFFFETALFANAKLKDVNMSESTFKGALISDGTFERVNFTKNKFVGVRFENVDFNGSDFTDAVFIRCYFNKVKFQGTNVKSTQFIDPIFVASELPDHPHSEPK